MFVKVTIYLFRFQHQRQQLTEYAFKWAELQDIFPPEGCDFHDNVILPDESNRRCDRRQVNEYPTPDFVSVVTAFDLMQWCFHFLKCKL